MINADVVIVGGGIIGMSIGYNIVKRGLKVIIFEANYYGFGSSGRHIGYIKERLADADLAKLASISINLHKELPSELKFHTLFRQGGGLTVALTKDEEDMLIKHHEFHRSIGLRCKLLYPDDVKKMFPYINSNEISVCCYDKNEGLIHPYALLWAYLEAFKKMGGEVRKPVKVRKISARDRGNFMVNTDIGDFEAEKVVIAAGIFSGRILEQVGLSLPIKFVTYEVFVTEPVKAFIDPVIERIANKFLLAQTMRGEVIGAMVMGEGSDSADSSYKFLEECSKNAIRMVPILRKLKILRQWTWICDVTTDGKPIIGKTSIDGLYVVCGLHDHGPTLAPIIGDVMGKLIVEDVLDPLIKPFSLNRFK